MPIKATRQGPHHPAAPSLLGVHMASLLHIVCPHCDSTNRVPRERLRDGGKCGFCHRPLYEGRPDTFPGVRLITKEANHSDIPLLVDFWATWCGPCRATAATVAQAGTLLEPNVAVIKVDSDAAPEL